METFNQDPNCSWDVTDEDMEKIIDLEVELLEPSDTIKDKVFELVYATDGKVYLDWMQKKPYKDMEQNDNYITNFINTLKQIYQTPKTTTTYISSNSCGSSCGGSSRC